MKSFWDDLERPFFVLAPLANVTDAAFRRVIAKYSKPHGPQVMWTEFVSADGLLRATPEGKAKLMRDLVYSEEERPIVAQFFTSDPEAMEHAAYLAAELGFDGVDINMGCPDRSVEAQGAGAKLILNPERAVELVAAAKRGALRYAEKVGTEPIPVSVKTRLGYNKDILEEPGRPDGGWLAKILSAEPAALTLHARTRKEMSKVAAHWERVKRAVEIRDALGLTTPIIGNGDAIDMADAHKKALESGADGVMLGRAIFGKPWLFAAAGEEKLQQIVWPSSSTGEAKKEMSEGDPRTFAEAFPLEAAKLHVAVEHTKLFEELLGDIKSFAIMKKHFKAYVEGFSGAKELRMQLMEATNAQEVENLIKDFLARPYTKHI